MTDPDGFPAVPKYRQRTWIGRTERQHRAVRRAARRGRSHPDPVIAKAARDWARGVLAPSRRRTRGLWELVLALVGDPFGGTLGTTLAERRVARRILAVEPPATEDR
ncbi:hypothetical protein [Geodermatophilus chilensis]|uniref:hypothetical protein n=1 Tax=Geodermatophilus chilensis TaxID=2035835 RepID=UPI000C261FFD|nr:hypothetical protein [Geodermatophilus chilensis]